MAPAPRVPAHTPKGVTLYVNTNLQRLDLEKTKNVIEVVGKLTVGLAAVCYVLGLVVVNVYLSKYSVYSLDLFRLNYVTAGLLALSPVLFGVVTSLMLAGLMYPLFAAVSRKVRSSLIPGERWDGLGANTLMILLVAQVLVATAVTYLIFWTAGIPADRGWGFIIGAALVTNVLCAIAMYFGVLQTQQPYLRQVTLMIVPALAVIVVLGHAVFFGAYLYEGVAAQLGGGRPREVEVLVNDPDARALLEEAGVEFQEDSRLAKNVRLLFATEGEYILLVKVPLNDREQAVTVKRDLIQIIRPKESFPTLGGDR